MEKENVLKLKDFEFFQELAETGDDLFCWMDSRGRFRYVSPSAEIILGMRPDRCLGKKAISFLHREDRNQTSKTIRNCVEKQMRSTTMENRIVSKTGQIRHLMWTVNLKYDANGVLIRINTVGKDISQRKLAEEQLRKSEEMWNKLFMASPTWIVLVTLEEGKIIDLNEPFCRDTGYRKEEVIGRTTIEIGLWADEKERYQVLPLIKEKGSLDKMPIKLRMKAGDIRDFLWSTIVIEIQEQKCLLSVLVDVSDLRQTQNQLAFINKKLEERSGKLAEMNSALKVLLDQRDKDKKELESRVWYNIKNMIQPHVNNLKQTKLTPTQHAYVDVVGNRLNEISSGIGQKLGIGAYNLSARELEVAGHIIEGKSNKQISDILNISVFSVESHRFSIRKKLGIKGGRFNLRTHLMSLTKSSDEKQPVFTDIQVPAEFG